MIREIVPIPTPAEGNDLYPLPPDYEDGTPEYQRVARINAVRQNLIKGGSAELRNLRVREAMRFFDLYYLHPDPDDQFDSYFYDREPLATPTFHERLYESFANYRFNAVSAPRGAAKSTCVKKCAVKDMVIRPKFTQVYSTATDPLAMKRNNEMKDAIYNNRRINDDFRDEVDFDGKIKPSRGDLATGSELFFLNNRSAIEAKSAKARQRGIRPHRYWLDDPEYDPDLSTDVNHLREALEYTLNRVIIPMMLRADVSVGWVGTFVSKRHLLWTAMKTKEDEDGVLRAEDPRFDSWNRTIVPITYEDDEGTVRSVWPEMWPIDDEERRERGVEGSVTVEEMPELMGMGAFRAEMEQRPGETTSVGFGDIDPDRHGYWVEDEDDQFLINPKESEATICWWREGQIERLGIYDFIRNSRIVHPMDTAYTTGPNSDWKVVATIALLRATNEMFVLDMWETKGRTKELIERAYRMAVAWRSTLHPEYVAKQGPEFESQCKQFVRNRSLAAPSAYVPPVIPHKVGATPKTLKIEGLSYRFEHGLIKLPFHKEAEPAWNNLFHQIREFNPEVPDGGLQKDDHIDTVQMGNAILLGKKGKLVLSGMDEDRPLDLREAVLQGKKSVGGVDPFPHAFQMMTVDEVVDTLERRGRKESNGTQRGGNKSVI